MKLTKLASLVLALGLLSLSVAADAGASRLEIQRRTELLKDFDAYVQLKKYPEAVAVFDAIAKEGMFPEYSYNFLPKAILALAKVGQDQKALAAIEQLRKNEAARKAKMAKAGTRALPAYEMMMVRSLNETHAALPSGAVKSELGKLLSELPKEFDLRAQLKASRSSPPKAQK